MAILLTCACGKSIKTKDENAGKKIKCPGCGKSLRVTDPRDRTRVQEIVQKIASLPTPAAATDAAMVAVLRAQSMVVAALLDASGPLLDKMNVLQSCNSNIETAEAQLGPGHEGVILLKKETCLVSNMVLDQVPPTDAELNEQFPSGGAVRQAALCPQCGKEISGMVDRFCCDSCGFLLKKRVGCAFALNVFFFLWCAPLLVGLIGLAGIGPLANLNFESRLGLLCGSLIGVGAFTAVLIATIKGWRRVTRIREELKAGKHSHTSE